MATFKEIGDQLKALVSEQMPPDEFAVMSEVARKAAPYDALSQKVTLSNEALVRSTVLDALDAAAALEFATIPPYLTALWSIKDQTNPIAQSIRSIIHEEMTHLGLACNMIASLGGTPSLTGDKAPQFPQTLPGGVHPELVVKLGPLDDSTLPVFLEIERPESIVPIEGQANPDFPDGDNTIGEFYEAVRLAVYALDPEFLSGSQLTGPLVPFVITSLQTLDDAIDLILAQGEGATGTPFETGPDDLAHYYRFKEVALERRLLWDEQTKSLKLGDQFARPATHIVTSPPAGGYDNTYPAEILSYSRAFNSIYSDMLTALERAWGAGGHASLLQSLELMFELRPIAQSMMCFGGKTGQGFVPEFRFLEIADR